LRIITEWFSTRNRITEWFSTRNRGYFASAPIFANRVALRSAACFRKAEIAGSSLFLLHARDFDAARGVLGAGGEATPCPS